MSPKDKPLVWLHGEVKTPPFGGAARLEAGYLLRELQQGRSIEMPLSRPMPSIGPRCHELRVTDERGTWRIIYRIDHDRRGVPEEDGPDASGCPGDLSTTTQGVR